MKRKFKVEITGETPYMQHRMDDKKLAEWQKSRGRIIENSNVNTEEGVMALFHCYLTEDGKNFFPAEHLKQCFIGGGSFLKAKVGNASKSMKNIVAGMWRIPQEQIPFPPFHQVDTRSAVNNNIKGRVVVHRPRWNEWSLEFELEVDDADANGKNILSNQMIREIIENGGRFVGVGSYRPQHTGEFGRFKVTKFEELTQVA